MYIIITGTSTGLGLALANALLVRNHQVFGISRRQTINHKHYEHLSLDLSNETNLKDIALNIPSDEEQVLLINNAGQIDPIDKVEGLNTSDLAKHYRINILAVHALCAQFIRETKGKSLRHIINISSGAGKYPVSGWSAYCTSKAAVDAMSQVIAKEYDDLRVWSLAPGIVDTPMQKTIRNTPESHFPELQRFIDYHCNGDLMDANDTASAIVKLINQPDKVASVVVSLRDFT